MKCKFIVVFLLLLTFIFIPFQTALAAPYSSSFQTPNVEDNVPQDLGTYSQSVVIELATAAICQIYGVNPTRENAKCLGVNPATGKIGFVEDGGGLVAVMTDMIASLYYIPIQPTEPLQYWANGFVGNKKTLAQSPEFTPGDAGGVSQEGKGCMADQPNSCCNGNANCGYVCEPVDPVGGGGVCRLIGNESSSVNTSSRIAPENKGGFAGLKPFAGIWLKFTQVVFLFYVAIFMLVGFGIMLRLPIDSRAVMSLQNQLPKIIMSIIFILFSFSIVGFLIDFMYLIIFLLFGLVNSVGGGSVVDMNPAQLQGTNPFGLTNGLGGIGGISTEGAASVGGFITPLFDNTFGRVLAGAAGAILGGGAGLLGGIGGAAIGGLVGGVIGGFVGGSKFLGFLGSLIAFLIIGFAIISSLFRLWWKLLQSYVLLLFNVILAPFWIMGGVLPGVKFGFGSWLKSCIGHLSVFPTTIMMFLVGKIIMDAVRNSGNEFFVPPLIGSSIGAEDIASIIGLGVILATPSIVDNVQKAIGASGVGAQSIGQSIGFGQSVVSTIRKRAVGTVWKKDQFNNPKGVLNKWTSDKLEKWGKQGGPTGMIGKTYNFFRPYSAKTPSPTSPTMTRELEQIRGDQPRRSGPFGLRKTAPQPLPESTAYLTNQIENLHRDFPTDKDIRKATEKHAKTIRQNGNTLTDDQRRAIEKDLRRMLVDQMRRQAKSMQSRDPALGARFEETTNRENQENNFDRLRALSLRGSNYLKRPGEEEHEENLTELINKYEQRDTALKQRQQAQTDAAERANVQNALAAKITAAPAIASSTDPDSVSAEELNQVLENLEAEYENAGTDKVKLDAITTHLNKLVNGVKKDVVEDINNQLKQPLYNNIQTDVIARMNRNGIDPVIVRNLNQASRQADELNNVTGLSELNKLGTQINDDPNNTAARRRLNEVMNSVNAKYGQRVNEFQNALNTTVSHLSTPANVPSTAPHLQNDPDLNALVQDLETRFNTNPFPLKELGEIQAQLNRLNDTTNPANPTEIAQIKTNIRNRLNPTTP